ncbi:hypothetical protein [Pelagibius sp.]|uniref:hypothetical protein n=1 Tax=Pelagibius sp. TaxID=1931238 RepID=UPI003BB1BC81
MPRILCAVLSTVCLLTILGACAGPSDPPVMRASAAAEARQIQIRVDDLPPAREITDVVLIDPEGKETKARDRQIVTREVGDGGASGPGVSVGATGGSSSGVKPFISLGYIFSSRRDERRSRYLTAVIPLADPEAYDSGFRDSRIEVRYRDAEGGEGLLTLAAPPP